jgi:hypothetical protein
MTVLKNSEMTRPRGEISGQFQRIWKYMEGYWSIVMVL